MFIVHIAKNVLTELTCRNVYSCFACCVFIEEGEGELYGCANIDRVATKRNKGKTQNETNQLNENNRRRKSKWQHRAPHKPKISFQLSDLLSLCLWRYAYTRCRTMLVSSHSLIYSQRCGCIIDFELFLFFLPPLTHCHKPPSIPPPTISPLFTSLPSPIGVWQ